MVILYRDPNGRKNFETTDVDSKPRITATLQMEFPPECSSKGLTLNSSFPSSELLNTPNTTSSQKT